ncbi:MAG: zinc protease [Chitinophagales bacterium]|nr:MAG: zinc protease [Chitinophagales bacterium]
MLRFEKFTLDNGLRVIVHEDHDTPMAVLNILYQVGAKDEEETKTGFAHLFEHLMFGGTENIPNYDEPLQRAGGESNAFTSNDLTNYYDLLPAENLEVAFWLESDRMQALKMDSHSLEVQRKVVCEEFKEHYLNQPYGDVWHKLSSLAYKVHPYKWPTIGKELAHIENASLEDVQHFFRTYYHPANAIMVVAGNVESQQVHDLCQKWFAPIPSGPLVRKTILPEPPQTEERKLEIEADVPLDAIVKAWHMGKRNSPNFYAMDLASNLLADGTSSRFYQNLVKRKKLFSDAEAYVTATCDEGLFVVEGRLMPGVTMQQAEEALWEEIHRLCEEEPPANEFQKVKNKAEAGLTFSDVNLLARATHLAFFEMLEEASRINREAELYTGVSPAEFLREVRTVCTPANCSTIHYYSKNQRH